MNAQHPIIAHSLDRKVIRVCHGFPDCLDPKADWNGHGTYVISVLLKTASEIDLFVARVVGDEGQFIEADDYQEVANVRRFSL